MARKSSRPGEVNKSEALRQLLNENPRIKAKEAVAALQAKNIEVTPGLFYFIKGKMSGRRGRRKRAQRMVANVGATMSNGATPAKASDVLVTINKVKNLAAEVGGLKKLKALVEALSN